MMKSSFNYRRKIFKKFGRVEVFQWETCTTLPLKSNEVLIKVHFIGVNYADIIARKGYYKWAEKPPICPGFEASGEVVAVGDDVFISVGKKVVAVSRFGGYSEYLIVEESRIQELPKGMSMEEAAALPAVYVTAYHSLVEIMRIRKGDSLLIQAVAGGVGTAALQIAKHVGLTVYGTASTDEKLEYAKELGLDHGINYAKEDFETALLEMTQGEGVKFLLDSLGGFGLRKGMKCLNASGHAVTIGAAGVVPPIGWSLDSCKEWVRIVIDMMKGGLYHPFQLIEENKGLSGVQILLLWDNVTYLQQILEDLIRLYKEGAVKPFIHKVFPLSDVAQAHEFVEQRKSHGKVLLATEGS